MSDKKQVAEFYQKNVSLVVKQQSSVFEPPIGRLRGNVCDSSLAESP